MIPPKRFLSDIINNFTSSFFHKVYHILFIVKLFTTTYHPQCNLKVERFNRTIINGLHHYIAYVPKYFDLLTDVLILYYNTKVSKTTKITPFELFLSRPQSSLPINPFPRWKLSKTRINSTQFVWNFLVTLWVGRD